MPRQSIFIINMLSLQDKVRKYLLSLLSLPINLSLALRLSAMVKAGLIYLAAAATELSPTSYPPMGVVKRALLRSGMSASGILSLPEVDGSDKGETGDSGGVATRYPNGGGVATVSPSSKDSISSKAEMELYRAGAGTVRASTSSVGGRYSGYSGPGEGGAS
nr:hypothetical protein [Tanacetum cinerariifolium]